MGRRTRAVCSVNRFMQDKVTNLLPKLKRKSEASNGTDEPDAKKAKLCCDVKQDPEKEAMKKQNKKMFYYRDLLVSFSIYFWSRPTNLLAEKTHEKARAVLAVGT